MQTPLAKTGLLDEAAELFRLIDAAPEPLRASLCEAASNEKFRLDWYKANTESAAYLSTLSSSNVGETSQAMRIATHHAAVAISPAHVTVVPPALIHGTDTGQVPNILAVELSDQSWLAFTPANKSWGLPEHDRWLIRLMLFAISITFVTAVAARRVSRPVERLAAAVRQFGNDPQAPPMMEVGPREIRQVIRTLNEMQDRIQTFVAHRTTMLAAISHDLRTPLTRIRLRGEWIDDHEEQTLLFRDVDELQAMVSGALAFFREDAVSEERTTLDLPQVLLTIANDYADRDVAIGYEGPAHGLYRGRPFALKRALTNLIENAIKYATTPEIELVRDSKSWTITISDRGPGIPAESLDSVLRPYHRLDDSTNRMIGGVGLGLTVTQSIVHGHGGSLILSNRIAGGLEARVVLPFDELNDTR